MAEKYKILLLDDELDLLELYQEMMKQLPSQPEVHTCDSGAKAIALLDSEPFNLMISDLNMPRMDGLQVLSIVRRKYPKLRVVVITSIMDEQFRARAYALGVDLFWQKPGNEQETKLFLESIEALMAKEEQGGFRGVQSKSLVDIIQLECMSQSSAVLKITNGVLEGRIWIINGEIIDATIGDLTGEDAFKKILCWKAGNFESLPPEPTRTRTVFNSYQGLLLDSAQNMDEAQAIADGNAPASEIHEEASQRVTPLQASAKVSGVDFLLSVPLDESKPFEQWGVESPETMLKFTRWMFHTFHELGERFVAGQVREVAGRGMQRHVSMVRAGDRYLCVGLKRNLNAEQRRETVKTVISKWVS
ncbi:MAG: response regulator [Verrucomicrobiota bacterium]